jgi:hypothetical protein
MNYITYGSLYYNLNNYDIYVGLRCLGLIKNKGTHQGDTKFNSAKILEQILIREVLSNSFNGSH